MPFLSPSYFECVWCCAKCHLQKSSKEPIRMEEACGLCCCYWSSTLSLEPPSSRWPVTQIISVLRSKQLSICFPNIPSRIHTLIFFCLFLTVFTSSSFISLISASQIGTSQGNKDLSLNAFKSSDCGLFWLCSFHRLVKLEVFPFFQDADNRILFCSLTRNGQKNIGAHIVYTNIY